MIAHTLLQHYGALTHAVLTELWPSLDLFMTYLERLVDEPTGLLLQVMGFRRRFSLCNKYRLQQAVDRNVVPANKTEILWTKMLCEFTINLLKLSRPQVTYRSYLEHK